MYFYKKKDMDKSEFIGNYLTKHMKNHNLPYGMAYFNLLAEKEKQAEYAWNRYAKKHNIK